jgi:hypothetical protein
VTGPWRELAAEPRYVLTADQDWAPEWTNEALLAWCAERDVPLHVFRTSPSTVLDKAAADGRISQGWHPNLLPGSSHGATDDEVVDYFTTHFPGAVSLRSHAFREGYRSWRAFAAAGIRYDSQHVSAHSGHLCPSVHVTGIRRLPVYLEDDVWLDAFPGGYTLAPVRHTFATPGLKIFNIHPVHFGLNTPSWAFYDERRAVIYAPDSGPDELAHPGAGIATLLDEIAAAVDGRFTAFPTLCAEVDHVLDASPDLVGGLLPPQGGANP